MAGLFVQGPDESPPSLHHRPSRRGYPRDYFNARFSLLEQKHSGKSRPGGAPLVHCWRPSHCARELFRFPQSVCIGLVPDLPWFLSYEQGLLGDWQSTTFTYPPFRKEEKILQKREEKENWPTCGNQQRN